MRTFKILSPRKAAERIADKLWSEAVRKMEHGHCAMCLRRTGLSAHHIITRSNKTVRWNTRNGIALCPGHHHFFAHKWPEKFRTWIITKRGQEWWDNLHQFANIRHVSDPRMEVVRLKSLLETLQ